MCNWKKWIWPGILTLLLLTLLAIWFKGDIVERDLSAKALDGLSANHSWASVSLDGRDLTLSGVAPSQDAVQQAIGVADAAYDVRVVANATQLLPIASPFLTRAEKSADKIVLSGAIPSEAARITVIDAAKQAAPGAALEDNMVLARGEPAEYGTLAGFAISKLAGLVSGSAEISDKDISVVGTAAGFDEYDRTIAALAGEIPSGGVVKKADFTAPTASPFEFLADYDGKTVTLSGHVSGKAEHDAIVASSRKHLPDAAIVNNLRIASGAPANRGDAADFALGFLPDFSEGQVSYEDTKFSITGIAVSSNAYSTALARVPKLTDGYTLEKNNVQPVGVSPYVWGARHDGKAMVLSGYVPGISARSAMNEAVSVIFPDMKITDRMEIAGGASERYEPGTGFGLKLMKHLSNGEAELVGDRFSITGRAASFDSYDASLTALKDFPAGLVRSQVSISPPTVSPYKLEASKSSNVITLDGHMPSSGVRVAAIAALKQANVGARIIDNTRIADGISPGVNWTDATRYALKMLGNLETGHILIINGKYTVEGVATSMGTYKGAKSTIAAGLDGGMTLAREAITPPVADPFLWMVNKYGSTVTVAGHMSDRISGDAAIAMVKSITGVDSVNDFQGIAAGKPEGYDAVRKLATGYINQLESSEAILSNKTLTVTGEAMTAATRNEIRDAVANSLPAGYKGSTNITLRKVVVTPVVVAESEPVDSVTDNCQAKLNSIIESEKIQFEVNRSVIKAESQGLLGKIVVAVASCPDSRIEIAGHTDSDGSDVYNQKLSEDRAMAVREYLVRDGISLSRLDARGYGESRPVADNDSDAGKAQNRRIEFQVIQ